VQLVANEINNFYFRDIPEKAAEAYKIDVAVPYITDDTIFQIAKERKIPCRIWCRIDEDTSVQTLNMLDRYLYEPGFEVRATHDYLHAKVIFLHGIGCYVGSANLSIKAMHNNIEVGFFVHEATRNNTDILDQLRTFFSCLNQYTSSILREDIKRIYDLFVRVEKDNKLAELEDAMLKARQKYREEWEKLKDSIFKDQKNPLYKYSDKSSHNRRITEEWKQCLDLQRKYVQIYKNEFKRPSWVPNQVEPFTEIDRMFDWYYGEYIQTGKQVPVMKNVEKGHRENVGKGDKNIRELFRLWSALETQPEEDFTYAFEERTPIQKDLMSKEKILRLSNDEIAQVVFHCFALMDHIDQFKSLKNLGLVKGDTRVPREEKAKSFVERYLGQANEHGKSFLEVLNYFIWDDKKTPWEKIWECTDQKSKWKYPGIDRSTLGELIGLARPTEYPVRNNRTSRVLNYLGFEVDCF
jgi:hypothetical protein